VVPGVTTHGAGLHSTFIPKRFTEILKIDAIATPPLSLITCLIICNVAGAVLAHVGTVIVALFVVTVVAKSNALQIQTTVSPTVIPALSITVPMNEEFAPSVVATGVQKISQADAPPTKETVEFATVLSAPSDLKINVPAPLRTIPVVPIDIAAGAQ